MLNNNNKIRFSVPLLFSLLLVWSCTDLEESPYSVVTPDNFYNTEAELTAGDIIRADIAADAIHQFILNL